MDDGKDDGKKKDGGKAIWEMYAETSDNEKKNFYKIEGKEGVHAVSILVLKNLLVASKKDERKKSIDRLMEKIKNTSTEKNPLEDVFKEYGLGGPEKPFTMNGDSDFEDLYEPAGTSKIKPAEGYTAIFSKEKRKKREEKKKEKRTEKKETTR